MTNTIKNQPAIYLTNLGKYNEGELIGQWLNVPCSNDEFKQALSNIGVDGVQYEEYFITDYEYIKGISEYSNIQEVNEIAELSKTIENIVNSTINNDFSTFDSDKDFIRNSLYDRVIELKDEQEYTQDEIIEELESYNIFTEYTKENCNALESLGYYLLEEFNYLNYDELDQEVQSYINVEKFGRHKLHELNVIDSKRYGKLDENYAVIIIQI